MNFGIVLMLEEERRANRESLMMHRRHLRDVNNPLELSEECFTTLFRISKEIALVLIQGIESNVNRSRCHGLPAHIIVLTAVRFYAVGSYQRCIEQEYNLALGQKTVSKVIAEVSKAIVQKLFPIYVRFPSTVVEREAVTRGFLAKHGIPDCLGCIDGTHISIVTPYNNNPDDPPIGYKNRKGNYSINAQFMCVRIWLEVGHACEPRRSALGRALALDWRVWVRGVSGRDISAFVHKVVFYLRPPAAFVYPKRVLQEPPYEIQESGCASIDIPIHVYLKYTSRPKRIRLRYSLHIENNTKISSESRCVYYDFENPPEELCRALMSSGGEVVSRVGKRLVVVLSDDEPPHRMKSKKYKFIEPIVHCKHVLKKRTKSYVLEDICSKCGESTTADLRKQLRAVAMTNTEINQVSQLYLAYTSYEKSIDALVLPPLSDPIYKIPETPASLKEALKTSNSDFSL